MPNFKVIEQAISINRITILVKDPGLNAPEKLNKECKQDIKPNIKFDRESKHDMNKITYEEEKIALVLGITSVFTVWWMFK